MTLQLHYDAQLLRILRLHYLFAVRHSRLEYVRTMSYYVTSTRYGWYTGPLSWDSRAV
jgi:hypothetical protein